MSYILGLCTMGSSSAALFKNGTLVAAIEEERLSRKKNDGSFPHKSIDEVLSIAGITLAEVDCIAVYWQPWRVWSRGWGVLVKLLHSQLSRRSVLSRLKELFKSGSSISEGSWLELFKIRRILTSKHGPTKAPIKFYDHHLTHQVYGEAMRDWDEFICLSYDGGGESHSTVLSVVNNHSREIISRHRWPNSLGHFYSTFTGYLGFKMLEGEYKMMGLAPYGEPVWTDIILKNILQLEEGGRYRLNTKVCDYHAALKNQFPDEMQALFGPPRLPSDEFTEKHVQLASSVQAAFEKALAHVLQPAVTRYPKVRRLVVSGGCALNVTANGQLLKKGSFDEVIIPPAPHDAGCAIGAAICAATNKIDLESIRNPYQGRVFSSDDIQQAFQTILGFLPSRYEESQLIEKSAHYLADGKVVAWFQGRAEFGPRALGARSFLADPRNDKIREDINAKIKKRELFRPFAPSVTEEAAQKIFELNQTSPYMNIVANVLSDIIPAVTHVDSTARVHTVSKKSNRRYHALLTRFGEITGVPVLLNTSFNIQEPIVYSPSDAIRTFASSGVDVLVIEDFIVERSELR